MENETTFTTDLPFYNVSLQNYTDHLKNTKNPTQQWVNVFLEWGLTVGVVLALFGNIIIIIVMTNKRNRHSPSSMFFTALSISDLSMFIVGSSDKFLAKFIGKAAFANKNFVIFKATTWLTTVYTSSWFIVCIAMERAISVNFPCRYSYMCTKKIKISVLITIVIMFLTMNASFNLLFWTVHFEGGKVVRIENIPNISRQVKWFDAVMVFFVPACLLTTGSICIIRGITKSVSKLKSTGSSTNLNGRKNRNNSVIWNLLGSVLLFLLTMTPFYILFVLDDQGLVSDSEVIGIVDRIFRFLKDMNAALNCYVYFLTGSKFRSDFKELFCKCQPQTNSRSNRS